MATSGVTNMEKTVLNLNTTQDELSKIIGKVYGENGSDAERQQLTQLLSQRANILTGMSNLYKLIADTARSIISNMRS